jgi:hypothetical protein
MEEATPQFGHRIAEIYARPVWQLDDIAALMSLPLSTLKAIIQTHPIGGAFLAGRRICVMQPVALAWMESLAEKSPYVRRKNNKRAAA